MSAVGPLAWMLGDLPDVLAVTTGPADPETFNKSGFSSSRTYCREFPAALIT
jgi:hypothetical protein